MPDPQLIGPVAPDTPSRDTASRRREHALPDDLLRDASHRLGVMSLVLGALWMVGTVLAHVTVPEMHHGGPDGLGLGMPDAIAATGVVASLLLFRYTRGAGRNPRAILDLGLAYLVLTAIDLGLVFHWEPMAGARSIVPEISWIGAVVLMFAAIVPSTPAKTALAGFLAVSMNPLAMLLLRAPGSWTFEAATEALRMHYPDYLLVFVAVVISHVVTSLGRQVAKARAMGSYQLGELLGRGGMGEVYKATHRMLARPAAIKLIRPEMIAAGDPAGAQLAVRRFRREAEAAANLRSPHTVELYDFGVTDDQTMYFVMELLEGMDLESLVRRNGPVPASRAVHILLQACASLEEAHVRGLVHRDIKPANVHLGRLGLVYDFVKILDFGLVKPIGEVTAEQPLTTQAGLLLGTPGYMAPEMAVGDLVDGRADLYALGCVAYYLLTGQQVFEGGSAMQIVSRHLQTAPSPPSQRAPAAVPAELDRVILACLAKAPADRPQTAGELARQLAAIDLEPWTQAQAEAWWQVHGLSREVARSEQETRLQPISSGDAVTRGG